MLMELYNINMLTQLHNINKIPFVMLMELCYITNAYTIRIPPVMLMELCFSTELTLMKFYYVNKTTLHC